MGLNMGALKNAASKPLDAAGFIVEGAAKKLVSVYTGDLRRDIKKQPIHETANTMEVAISVSKEYFEAHEYGIGPMFVKFEDEPDLKTWAKSKGFNVEKMAGLRVHIETGTEKSPKRQEGGGYSPVLRPGLYMNIRKIDAVFRRYGFHKA